MNYSKLSNFEINKAVAMVVGRFKKSDYSEISGNFHSGKPSQDNYRVGVIHDYCNNPADAWPIILENEISIIRDVSTNDSWEAIAKGWVTMKGFESSIDNKLCHVDKNPLRAAMIVFLMTDD